MLKNWYSSNFSLSHSLRSFLHHFGINKTPTILSMFCGYNVSEREKNSFISTERRVFHTPSRLFSFVAEQPSQHRKKNIFHRLLLLWLTLSLLGRSFTFSEEKLSKQSGERVRRSDDRRFIVWVGEFWVLWHRVGER